MKTLLTTTALLALLSAGPALAQSDTAPMTEEPPAATQEMAPDAGMAPDAPAMTEPAPAPDATAPEVAPDQSLSETDEAAPAPDVAPDQNLTETDEVAPAPDVAPDQNLTETDQAAPAPADTMAATETFISEQAQEEDLASNWIGKTLYNAADENLGDINDILIGTDGGVRAVIVGVGGFLGIGQKDVAVNFDAIEPRTDADGNVELYINATQDQLEAAPDFMTLADIRAEQQANQPMVTDPALDPAAPAPMQ